MCVFGRGGGGRGMGGLRLRLPMPLKEPIRDSFGHYRILAFMAKHFIHLKYPALFRDLPYGCTMRNEWAEEREGIK